MLDKDKIIKELDRYTKTMNSLKPVPYHLHEAINTGMATACVEVLRILVRSMEDVIDGNDSEETEGKVQDSGEGYEQVGPPAPKRKPNGRGRVSNKNPS